MNKQQSRLIKLAQAMDNTAEFAFKETERLDEKIDTTKSELENKIENISLTPGEKGDKGDKGEPGEIVLDGRDGKDGTKGEKGADGKDGKDGLNGKDGINGLDGKDGVDGEKGDKPNHKWDGTKLAFEKPDGKWGKYVDLMGKPGDSYRMFGGGGSNVRLKSNGNLVSDAPIKILNFTGGGFGGITPNGDGQFTISINDLDVSATWGNITGNIALQTDLTSLITNSNFWSRDAVNGYLYPKTITDRLLLGSSTQIDPTNILEVTGNSLFTGKIYLGDTDARIYHNPYENLIFETGNGTGIDFYSDADLTMAFSGYFVLSKLAKTAVISLNNLTDERIFTLPNAAGTLALQGLSGTKTYYVADSSGGATTRKLTFTNGILTSET